MFKKVAIIHTKRGLKSGDHSEKDVKKVTIIHTMRLKKWRSFIERFFESGYHPYKEVKKVAIIHRNMF